jgi:hypothetical protein
MANCIKNIYIECLGYQQADNGYWNPVPLLETQVPNYHRSTVRAPTESTARPKKAIRISDNYSVASRAPDPRRYLDTWAQQNQIGLLSQILELHMCGSQTLPRLPEPDRITNQEIALGGGFSNNPKFI